MKKLLLLLSLLLCLTLLVACGKSDDKKPNDEENDPSQNQGPNDPTPEIPDPVIDFGFYTITNSQNKQLSAPANKGDAMTFDANAQNADELEALTTWTIEPKLSPTGDLIYVLYCTYDPHDAAEADRLNSQKGVGMTRAGYDDTNRKQMWTIVENEDGTFKIISYMNPKFCIVNSADGGLTMELVEKAGDAGNFKIEEKTTFNKFLTFYSKNRKVIFQLPKNIHKDAGITPERVQQFVEDTVTIYNTYIDFTDFVTYDHIILKAYETEKHIAYVVNGYMCVSSDKDFIVADLKRMQERTTNHKVHDINFMMLHEMGHMFDRNQKWSFEGEAMTDIKAAYVLYANPDCVAAPSEKPSQIYYNHTNITDVYKDLGGAHMTNGTYSIYCCAAIFVDIIQDHIKDWNKVKEMYHWYANNKNDIDPIKWYKEKNNLEDNANVKEQVARLDMFIAKLTEYGGVDVRSLINDQDYEMMYKKCNGEI